MAPEPLSRQALAHRIAQEFQQGWVVNLGMGMPVLCSNFIDPDLGITFHSENGVVGYGPEATKGEVDLHLVNASGGYVVAQPGMAIVDHAMSFALIRGGYIDVTVLGSYEVAENGDFANWKVAGRKGGGIGGAMDLAVGAKRVFVAMEHTTRDGKPRLLKRCTLAVTAPGVVKLVATNLGIFDITDQGFVMREIAPGWTPEQVQELTEAKLTLSPNLKEVEVPDGL